MAEHLVFIQGIVVVERVKVDGLSNTPVVPGKEHFIPGGCQHLGIGA